MPNKRASNKTTGNKSNIRGKKPIYQTNEEFEKAVEDYFKTCDKKKKPYTVSGLSLHLGFLSRETILDYANYEKHSNIEEKEKLAIADTIKKARLRIEESLEINLQTGKQVIGTIFNLKNNYKWVDKTDIDHGGEVVINITGLDKL